MAKKTKKSSVSTIMISTIVLGLAVFSVVLFVMMSRLLHKGLESYFQEDLEGYSELYLKEIRSEQENLVKIQNNLLGSLDYIYSKNRSLPANVVGLVL